MTVRPIIFSEPMVRALLAGHKTQTRRLATSPLRRCKRGDLLYVRETFAEVGDGYLTVTRADYPDCVPPHFENVPPADGVKWRPCIHMPRRLSRLTLEVADVRVEPLQSISDDDALAEGITKVRDHCYVARGTGYDRAGLCHSAPSTAYACLWSELHGNESWDTNPDVLVLTFNVRPGNVDRLTGIARAA